MTEKHMQAKFGLSLSNRSVVFGWASIQDLMAAARRAEDSGFYHGVWVGDNLLAKPRLDPIVTLTALATATQRLKLGTICMASFPYRHPIRLAIQWASLDVVSGGRTIFGICNGPSAKDGPKFAHELEVMGIPSKERASRLVEGVQIIRRLWSEEKVTHEGKYYQFADVELLPKPVQNPVPIHIAINPKGEKATPEVVERVLRRVAKYGDGWQADTVTPETFRSRFDRIKELTEQEGRDSSQMEGALHMMVNINDDMELGYRQAAEYFELYYPPGYLSRERIELWLIHGSAGRVIEKIRDFLDAGCTMPVIRLCSRNLKEQLGRCIEHVLPAFKTD